MRKRPFEFILKENGCESNICYYMLDNKNICECVLKRQADVTIEVKFYYYSTV